MICILLQHMLYYHYLLHETIQSLHVYINISYDYVDVNTHACKFQEHIYLQYIVYSVYICIL